MIILRQNNNGVAGAHFTRFFRIDFACGYPKVRRRKYSADEKNSHLQNQPKTTLENIMALARLHVAGTFSFVPFIVLGG